jgi:hypothetical protein
MDEFDEQWRAAVSFRRASRELEGLLHAVYNAFRAPSALPDALEAVLVFLTSTPGRTDANCSVTDHFISATEAEWRGLEQPLRSILDDMGGTLHDAIYAPNIARTFGATPEQLLERVRALR